MSALGKLFAEPLIYACINSFWEGKRQLVSKVESLSASSSKFRQKSLAETEYKVNKGIFLKGANTYSQFLYENYYGTDLFPEEKVQEIAEETNNFWKNVGEELVELIPGGNLLFKKNREQIKDQAIDLLLENRGTLGVTDFLTLGLAGMASYFGNFGVGENMEDVTKSLTRGAIRIVNIGADGMIEGYEQRNFQAQTRTDLYNDSIELQDDIDRYRELINKQAVSIEGEKITDEELSYYEDGRKKGFEGGMEKCKI